MRHERVPALAMRALSFISLLLASWLIIGHFLPAHCAGTFRVRTWTFDVLGSPLGLEQYGVYRPAGRGLVPVPMTTIIRLGPVGTVNLHTLGHVSLSIFSAAALHLLGAWLLKRYGVV